MKRILHFLDTIKKELAIALIVLMCEPLLKWLWGTLLRIAISASDMFSAIYYSMVASNSPSKFLGDYLIVSGYFFAAIMFTRNINSRTKVLEEIVNGSSEEKKPDPIEMLKKYRRLNSMAIAVTAFTGSVLYTVHFSDIMIYTENSSFNRKLDIVSPFVSEKEIKILKSKWARMKSKNDYKEIDKTINDIIEKEDLNK